MFGYFGPVGFRCASAWMDGGSADLCANLRGSPSGLRYVKLHVLLLVFGFLSPMTSPFGPKSVTYFPGVAGKCRQLFGPRCERLQDLRCRRQVLDLGCLLQGLNKNILICYGPIFLIGLYSLNANDPWQNVYPAQA